MLNILRRHRDVLTHYQQRFKYILVDEYQDTNQVQYLWLRLLAQERKNICVVGDDDQSIYSWRGAEVANILKFEKDFPGAAVIKLEQNYRSTPQILAAASGLIAANSERLGKQLWTELPAGEKVRVIGVWDAPEEARRVGEEIERLEHEGAPLEQVAILVRAQYQTREFEDRFIQIGLNYRIVGGFRFYERAEIRDALAYLRVIEQPADDLAFERIHNQPKRGLGAKTLAAMRSHARRTQTPLAAASLDLADSDELPARARGTLIGLLGQIAHWRQAAEIETPANLLRMVLAESGYDDMLAKDRGAESAGRADNLVELARAMEDYDTLTDFPRACQPGDGQRPRRRRREGHHHDHACGERAGVRPCVPAWLGGRRVPEPALARRRRARQPRGGAPPRLCRDHPRAAALHDPQRRQPAHLRPVDQQHPEPLRRGIARGRGDARDHHDRRRLAMARQLERNRRPLRPCRARCPRTRPDARPRLAARAHHRLRPHPQAPRRTHPAAPPASPPKPRADIALGARVFHDKFGYGEVMAQEGNKLEIAFEQSGTKRVLDSFVTLA